MINQDAYICRFKKKMYLQRINLLSVRLTKYFVFIIYNDNEVELLYFSNSSLFSFKVFWKFLVVTVTIYANNPFNLISAISLFSPFSPCKANIPSYS